MDSQFSQNSLGLINPNRKSIDEIVFAMDEDLLPFFNGKAWPTNFIYLVFAKNGGLETAFKQMKSHKIIIYNNDYNEADLLEKLMNFEKTGEQLAIFSYQKPNELKIISADLKSRLDNILVKISVLPNKANLVKLLAIHCKNNGFSIPKTGADNIFAALNFDFVTISQLFYAMDEIYPNGGKFSQKQINELIIKCEREILGNGLFKSG